MPIKIPALPNGAALWAPLEPDPHLELQSYHPHQRTWLSTNTLSHSSARDRDPHLLPTWDDLVPCLELKVTAHTIGMELLHGS